MVGRDLHEGFISTRQGACICKQRPRKSLLPSWASAKILSSPLLHSNPSPPLHRTSIPTHPPLSRHKARSTVTLPPPGSRTTLHPPNDPNPLRFFPAAHPADRTYSPRAPRPRHRASHDVLDWAGMGLPTHRDSKSPWSAIPE